MNVTLITLSNIQKWDAKGPFLPHISIHVLIPFD